ncbi:MAG: HlyD family type I secretion periplasmic adaptor subunit [Pseudomonadota bacterium]
MSTGELTTHDPHKQPAPAGRPLAGGLGGTPSLLGAMKRPSLYGLAFLAVFFVVGGGWAALAPLTSAIIASGVVSPDGNRRTVQHLEGGIIRDIRVREGSVVDEGELLMVLADVNPQARTDATLSRLRALAAAQARLVAEQKGTDTINFDHPELQDRRVSGVAEALTLEITQFATRRENLQNRMAVLRQRIEQLNQQVAGLKIQLASAVRQSDLIDQEIADVQQLVNQGLERRPRLLALQRTKADLEGAAGNFSARIAQAQEAIGETELQIMSVRSDRAEDVEAQLASVGTELAELEQALRQERDQLARTEIVAPVGGTILDLRFQTIGGVILPGEAVLDIVPDNEELLIDARVSPSDIDQVTPDLPAQVVFPSFPQRNLPRLTGTVRTVGADALEDPRDGQRYYSVRIGIGREQFSQLDADIVLKPGMPAEGYITTGERTFLTYLIRPFVDTVRRSFRET